jgi:Tol biopolymer transport system component
MRGRLFGSVGIALAVAIGTLAAQQTPPAFQLAWVDRQGVKTPVGTLPPGAFAPRVSPDGRRVAFDTFDGSVWIAELTNLAAAKRFGAGRFPMWSPDGTRLLFAGPKGFDLFWQASDGTGTADLIAEAARAPESWSTQLGLVSYITLTGTTDYDIWAFAPADRMRRAILAEPGTAQMGSRFSPDGKWIAYQANDTGRHEIYVEPFPRGGARTKISDAGGERPVWSPNGREIFYDNGGALYVATITSTTPFTAQPPVALPIKGFMQSTGRRLWDLSPDGARFLMMFQAN